MYHLKHLLRGFLNTNIDIHTWGICETLFMVYKDILVYMYISIKSRYGVFTTTQGFSIQV
jgi:hypothetical protein